MYVRTQTQNIELTFFQCNELQILVFIFKIQTAISVRYALFVFKAVQGRGWGIILLTLYSFFLIISRHCFVFFIIASLQKCQKNKVSVNCIIDPYTRFQGRKNAEFAFQISKTHYLFLFRRFFHALIFSTFFKLAALSSTTLHCLRQRCIVFANDVLGLNRYFLVEALFAILSLLRTHLKSLRFRGQSIL